MTRNDELMRKGTALLKAFSHADDMDFALVMLHKYTQLTNMRRVLSVDQRDADALDRYNHICAGGRGWFIANGEVFDIETHKQLIWAEVVGGGGSMRDDMNVAARKKLGKKNWSLVESESITGGLLLTKSETKQVNGKTKWKPRKECEKVLITMDDLRLVEKEYEESTGNCHKCMGEKEEVFGWNIETGIKKRTCARCNGTGKKP